MEHTLSKQTKNLEFVQSYAQALASYQATSDPPSYLPYIVYIPIYIHTIYPRPGEAKRTHPIAPEAAQATTDLHMPSPPSWPRPGRNFSVLYNTYALYTTPSISHFSALKYCPVWASAGRFYHIWKNLEVAGKVRETALFRPESVLTSQLLQMVYCTTGQPFKLLNYAPSSICIAVKASRMPRTLICGDRYITA